MKRRLMVAFWILVAFSACSPMSTDFAFNTWNVHNIQMATYMFQYIQHDDYNKSEQWISIDSLGDRFGAEDILNEDSWKVVSIMEGNAAIESDSLKEDKIEVYHSSIAQRLTVASSRPYLDEVKVYNLLGEEITDLTRTIAANSKRVTLDISGLNEGTLLLNANGLFIGTCKH